MNRDWDTFLMPYAQAVSELKVKLRGMRSQFLKNGEESPVEFVTGRVKPVESIQEKMIRRQISDDRMEEDMQDIAGVRVMCQFIEDIYEVVNLIRKRTDMTIVEERDYIENEKPSGYRSYHMVVEYPVQMMDEQKLILAEIQIRTMQMNFWATIEHSLNYKFEGEFPTELRTRLKNASVKSYQLDKEMSDIRKEIMLAQKNQKDG